MCILWNRGMRKIPTRSMSASARRSWSWNLRLTIPALQSLLATKWTVSWSKSTLTFCALLPAEDVQQTENYGKLCADPITRDGIVLLEECYLHFRSVLHIPVGEMGFYLVWSISVTKHNHSFSWHWLISWNIIIVTPISLRYCLTSSRSPLQATMLNRIASGNYLSSESLASGHDQIVSMTPSLFESTA